MSTTNVQPSPLDVAAYALTEAKLAEDAARNHRLACENRLIELVGVKEEGTKSAKTAFYKVSTVGSLTRSLVPNWREILDDDAIDAVSFAAVLKMEPKLSVSGLKQVATANPEAYRVICKAIVAKPAKVAVKVELIEAKKDAA
jgi:hypothetical protein